MKKRSVVEKELHWAGFSASVPGGGHIRHGIPCQDASAVMTAPRPAVIVCDGRGSASLSHFGAQGAVDTFRFQVAVLEPFLVNILDAKELKLEQWIKFCRIMYRTLMQVKYDLAEKHGTDEKEFDCTVAFAIAGKKHIGCFQVGDGSIVLRQNGVCKTAFLPEKGEYANQTHFLRAGGEEEMRFQYTLVDARMNSGIAITSDGPEYLMFNLADMKPGEIFDTFMDDLRKEELCRQDLMDYLTRRAWAEDPRGSDDRSLALLARVGDESEVMSESEVMQNAIPASVAAVEDISKTSEQLEKQAVKSEAAIQAEELLTPEQAEKQITSQPEPVSGERMAADEQVAAKSDSKKKAALGWILVLVSALLVATVYLVRHYQQLQVQQLEIQSLKQQLKEREKSVFNTGQGDGNAICSKTEDGQRGNTCIHGLQHSG